MRGNVRKGKTMMMRILMLLGVLTLGLAPQAWSAATVATLPAANVNVTMPTIDGSTLNATCGTLQSQLNAAAALNVNLTHRIIIATGTTCTGRFTLPSHIGTGWILITGPNMASLPPTGTRVGPADAALMPKLRNSSNANEGIIDALTGAQRYRFIGIEFLENTAVANDNWICLGFISECANATSTGYFILDRVIIRDTTSTHSSGRAIKADTQLGNVALIDSYCSGMKIVGQETQCFQADRVGGPVLIQNNYLEAAGENIMFCGGADSSAEAYLPHDLTIKLNNFFIPNAWHFQGGGFVVKTELELKCGVRVLIEANTLENMPSDGVGWVMRLTPRNQGGPTTYSDVSDLTIRHNLIRNVWNGFQNITADDQAGAQFVTKHTKRWNITNNLVYGLGAFGGGASQGGKFFQSSRGKNVCSDASPNCQFDDLIITHNTIDNVRELSLCFMQTGVGNEQNIDFDFKDNLINAPSGNGYGIVDCNAGGPWATNELNQAWGATWAWTNNTMVHPSIGSDGRANYPQGTNSYPTSASTIQWTNQGARDYTLLGTSAAKNSASDGTDRGVNFTTYTAARSGSTAPPPSDTAGPSTPTIIVSASGGGQANPSWTASTDNVGVTGYELLRCTGASCTPTVLLTTTASGTLFFTDTLNVDPSTVYGYRVRAFDAATNRSLPSTIVYVTTPATFKSILAPSPDTFDRANNTDLGAAHDAGYTAQGPCQIVSNRIRSTTVNTRCYETYNGVTPGNDQWGQITLSTLAGAQLADICVPIRAANAATVTSYTFCAVRNGANTLEIREYTTGTPVVLAGNATYTPANGEKIRGEVEGTTIRGYLIRPTGQEILAVTATDASIASGKVGVSIFVATGGALANVEADDLVVGDYGGSAIGAIAVDSVSQSVDNTTISISWNHTVGSGSNRFLGVCVLARDTVVGDVTVSSATYGGTALTFLRGDTRTAGGNSYRIEQWYILNPNPGTAAVSVTWAGAPSAYGAGHAISFTGVNQASPIDSQAANSGAGATISSVITTVADMATIYDCVMGQDNAGVTIGTGQTSRVNRLLGSVLDAFATSTVTGKTPAGAETMDWTQGGSTQNWVSSSVSLKPASVTPVIPPTITGLTPSATGFTVTHGATTSTQIRIAAGNNAGTLSFAAIEPIASFPGGVYTRTWPDGFEFVCVYPIDAAGVENTASGATVPCGTLSGIVQPLDTTPIVMTLTQPTSTLNQGTTSTVFAIGINKAGTCKWDTANTTYDLMASLMSGSSLSFSANTGAILSNGTTTHVYTQCRFTNSAGTDITTTTALDISISVAAGAPTDTTAPSTVSGLAAVALGQAQASLTWTAATDNVAISGYNLYLCPGVGCTTYVFAGFTGNVTQIVLNLTPQLDYCAVIRAVDTSNNLSAADSNIACFLTTPIADVTPPSTMQNLRVAQGPFTQTVVLGWDAGTDNSLAGVTATIEQCTGAACSDFVVVQQSIFIQQLQVDLTPGTLYRFRGIFVDQSANRSVAYSNIVDVTTMTTGLPRPRTLLGSDSGAATRGEAGARTPIP